MDEPWLRGPVAGVIAELQPVAHELLFAKEELTSLFSKLSDEHAWQVVGGVATIGYHVRHCSGSTLRMLTYARGESLTDEQFAALAAEKIDDPSITSAELLQIALHAIDAALAFVQASTAELLDEPRAVGRKQLPSNVRGLLYEIAVHTSRHVGQIATTARVLKHETSNGVLRN